jgi:hypothetical protein
MNQFAMMYKTKIHLQKCFYKCLIKYFGLIICIGYLGRDKTVNNIPYLVFIGGKSNAFDSCSKLLRCEPSQKGLLEDNPQRQRPKAVLPSNPYTLPSQSIISKSPSILIDPLLLIISFVLLIMLFIFLSSKIAKYMLTISYCRIFFGFTALIYLNSILCLPRKYLRDNSYLVATILQLSSFFVYQIKYLYQTT